MLTLSRKPGQSIKVGKDITILVESIRGSLVRIGIEAPAGVIIWREELYESMTEDERLQPHSAFRR